MDNIKKELKISATTLVRALQHGIYVYDVVYREAYEGKDSIWIGNRRCDKNDPDVIDCGLDARGKRVFKVIVFKTVTAHVNKKAFYEVYVNDYLKDDLEYNLEVRDHMYFFKDYGDTWALTKKELQK